MELYKIGKIVSIGKTHIILDSNYTGHIIYVANANDWNEDKYKTKKVFVYNHSTEYTNSTYGFRSFNERVLFEDLLSVNGIGPKTALNILKEGTEQVISLIARGEIKSLADIPQMGIRLANQIVFELRTKYEKMNPGTGASPSGSNELRSSLKVLGFNQRQIDYAVENVKVNGTIEQLIEEAIKAISSAKFA